MSYQEPAASGYELTASEIDPAHHAIVPSDDQQDLAFRSIRAIDPNALIPQGAASLTPERRTPKGIRPMIWVRLNETKSAVLFEVTLHTGQCVQVHVPFDSWRLGTCDTEAVRAAIQKAYLNLLRRKADPVIVKPGMISLKVLSKHDPQLRTSNLGQRQSSLDSTSTRTSLDSSRYNSPHPARQPSHPHVIVGHSRSQGSHTPHRSHSHPAPGVPLAAIPPIPSQPAVRPNVLKRLNTAVNASSPAGSRSQPVTPTHPHPGVYVNVIHGGGQQPYVRVKQADAAGYDPYTNTRYVGYAH
ncbi:hypothetical protein FRC17_005345 [Serendipita sp. 399]|nr:hypothetical protein FRC17_005345 [Serendipita sp. 399]